MLSIAGMPSSGRAGQKKISVAGKASVKGKISAPRNEVSRQAEEVKGQTHDVRTLLYSGLKYMSMKAFSHRI